MLASFFSMVRWEWAAVGVLLVVALVASLALEALSYRAGQREAAAERLWQDEARQVRQLHALQEQQRLRLQAVGAAEHHRRRATVIADAREDDV
jgi:hypothetical protein